MPYTRNQIAHNIIENHRIVFYVSSLFSAAAAAVPHDDRKHIRDIIRSPPEYTLISFVPPIFFLFFIAGAILDLILILFHFSIFLPFFWRMFITRTQTHTFGVLVAVLQEIV